MIVPLVKLTRPWYSLPVSSGLIVICLYLTNGDISTLWTTVITACIALCCIMSGTYVLNDVTDVSIDAINCPSRAIPSGMVSIKIAMVWAISLYVFGLVLALLCGLRFLMAMLLVAAAAIFYNAYAKRVGIWKDVWSAALMTSLYPLALTLVDVVPSGRSQSLYYSAAWFFTTCISFQMFKDVGDTTGDTEYHPCGIARYSGRRGFLVIARLLVVVACFLPLLIWLLGYCKLVFLITSLVTIALGIAAGLSKPQTSVRLIYAEVAVFTAGAFADILILGP